MIRLPLRESGKLWRNRNSRRRDTVLVAGCNLAAGRSYKLERFARIQLRAEGPGRPFDELCRDRATRPMKTT